LNGTIPVNYFVFDRYRSFYTVIMLTPPRAISKKVFLALWAAINEKQQKTCNNSLLDEKLLANL